jgi:predicted DsbA family dithiol-disulfide isomerase
VSRSEASAGAVKTAKSKPYSGDGLEAIKDAGAPARRFRAGGMPFFIVNGKITPPGAQQRDAFLEASRQAAGSQPLPP